MAYDNKNNENNEKNLNMFGLTDIEKIQADIECDLHCDLHKVTPETAPLFQESAFDPAPAPVPTFNPPPSLEEWLKADIHDNPAGVTNGFYRETIKNTKEKRRHGKGFGKAVAVFLAIVLGMGALGFGVGAGYGYFHRQEAASPADAYANGEIMTLTSVGYSFENVLGDSEVGTLADIVEFLKPAVVGITSQIESAVFSGPSHGSGLIFAENDEKIFIVTNLYVVRGGGREFAVTISDHPPLIGRPVGEDSAANLAVLSIEKSQLVAAGIDTVVIATFGDSDNVRVGDTVLAIGNPMGHGTAVTRGVISSAEQTVVLSAGGRMVPLLQTDAAINYGNSGGPLINTRGEVIGINFDQASNIIFGRTNVEGMGFSITSNTIVPIIDELVSGRRPALGIMGGTVTEETAEDLGIPPIGVFVSEVFAGRAAERGGMMVGDIITAFNGQQVFTMQQLIDAIRASAVGEPVEVRVLRYGTTAITLYIELDVMVVDNF